MSLSRCLGRCRSTSGDRWGFLTIRFTDSVIETRLRDRLATSELRLSVLLAAPSGSGGVPASASAGGLVHGAARGERDPAAAQTIVAITDEGDQGLIALNACQSYVKEVLATK